jgi:hypothetical protein
MVTYPFPATAASGDVAGGLLVVLVPQLVKSMQIITINETGMPSESSSSFKPPNKESTAP